MRNRSILHWTFLAILLAFPIIASSQPTPNDKQSSKTGLIIKNGINRGIGYTDSLGTAYNLRYIPIIITNDSTIPIRIQIAFDEEYDYPPSYADEKFKVIPMPKEWGMDGVEITDSIIDELKNYIDKPILDKTLKPGETIVAAISTRYRPTGHGIVPNLLFLPGDSISFPKCDTLITFGKSPDSDLALELKLDIYAAGNRKPLMCILIPCGQISYPEQ